MNRSEHSTADGLPFRVSLEAINKGVGLVALGLPFALLAVWAVGGTCDGINSISHYYFTRLGGDLLVGALCFIGTLLLFFFKLPFEKGQATVSVDGFKKIGRKEIIAARLAGLCAFGVALLPTTDSGCEVYEDEVARVFLSGTKGSDVANTLTGTPGFDFWVAFGNPDGWLGYTHYGSAIGMFAVLAYFSLFVFTRQQSPNALGGNQGFGSKKKARNGTYYTCGALILISMIAMMYKFLTMEEGSKELASWNAANLTFWFEALGLVAFGVSWCVKGRLFAIFRDPGEVAAS